MYRNNPHPVLLEYICVWAAGKKHLPEKKSIKGQTSPCLCVFEEWQSARGSWWWIISSLVLLFSLTSSIVRYLKKLQPYTTGTILTLKSSSL